MKIEVGEKAPDFTLETQSGETVSLSDYVGKKNVVLYFYPKDMTPGCTTQACDFRDHHASFEGVDAVILGVSPDPKEKHKRFIDKHDLPFELLVDQEHEAAEKYGVWKLKKTFGKEYMGIERSTFAIDKEGRLAKEWRGVRVKGHVEDTLKFVQNELNH
ncbi:thioredoxin-dependent thiol peroxidase [Jeotgalibacillus sp. S-D1]|uniref:thioredoxin-dependent thiol peroxidase n=1 Tax=Jeotgalibacillus sp. S-D1 TaxID=2552189 RepID=UPI0010599537|nr:thioredoxin-dependent thiol peroxidase [Jeotgalibacillus sp. S-D1]TDL30643.1 thioredoxin-dependent thiol peroxidase [Jeotgalibacillus sp. S-D1]